jgi:predicted nucleotide-binding protein
MEKKQHYPNTRFSGEVIEKSLVAFTSAISGSKTNHSSTSVTKGDTQWKLETDAEFFAEYRKQGTTEAWFFKTFPEAEFIVHVTETSTYVTIGAQDRNAIETGFNVFEDSVIASKLPEPKKEQPPIFIGHGHSNLWRDLKDHLHEKHRYPVQAYEIGARAGHTIRDILESMMNESSFAILVMTAEDRDEDGKFHPRDNVIHELGLFQGRLGFNYAIVLLEEGTEEFSNIHGIQQIRFSKGNIKETFGEILATLRRDF